MQNHGRLPLFHGRHSHWPNLAFSAFCEVRQKRVVLVTHFSERNFRITIVSSVWCCFFSCVGLAIMITTIAIATTFLACLCAISQLAM